MTGPPLPDSTTPGRVRLQVADLERSLGWYRDLMGLHVLDRTQDGARLGVEDGPTLVELVEVPGSARAPNAGRTGLYHFAILLPARSDLARFLARIAAEGVPIGSADHLVSEALYLHDPDGLGIEVYADRPRRSWERTADGIRMASLPLNARELLELAGDEPWAGMPAGTTLGHVHLHVGDIPAARRFYSDGLGLDVTVDTYPGALFLSAGGYHHHLGVNTWAGRGARPPGERDARLLEWTLGTSPDAARAAAARLKEAGHDVAEDDDGWRVLDPWGTPLRLT